jgi:serine/threonine-protein kinase ATR
VLLFCVVRAGETVHVDFGCLFDRGLVLEVPERVPFRLTQNVVDCFGVSGVEGTFRRAAEMTLQVIRFLPHLLSSRLALR